MDLKPLSSRNMSKDSRRKKEAEHFENGVDLDWQYTDDFNGLVKSFHDKKARQPDQKEAKKLNSTFITRLQEKLKSRNFCSDIKFTGSAYEQCKVRKNKNDPDVEFDIMVIVDLPNDVEIIDDQYHGFKKLRATNTKSCVVKEDKDGFLQAKDFAENFFHHLIESVKSIKDDAKRVDADSNETQHLGRPASENCLDAENDYKEGCERNPFNDDSDDDNDELVDVKLGPAVSPDRNIDPKLFLKDVSKYVKWKKHGPAVQMNVDFSYSEGAPNIIYSVDIVPTVRIKMQEKDMYLVAKPLKRVPHEKRVPHSPCVAWRMSFSLEEKKKFRDTHSDRDNGCRKLVFRVLKAMRNQEPGLAHLTSYILKTVLFREMEEGCNPDDWKIQHLGRQLMRTLRRLRDELKLRRISHYFLPEVNLLQDPSQSIKPVTSGQDDRDTVKQMEERIACLYHSQKKMEKILKSVNLVEKQQNRLY